MIFKFPPLNNGNRTKWSPIRSVIIRVIDKIGRPPKRESDLLIMSMITDRIGRHEFLLPIKPNYDKIWERNWTSVVRFHKKSTVNSTKCKTTARSRDVFCPLTLAWRFNCPFNCPSTLFNYKHEAYTALSGWACCLISAQIELVKTNLQSHKIDLNPFTPKSSCNSPCCLPYNPYDVCSENLELDQRKIPNSYFSFHASLGCLTLYWYLKKKFSLSHSWECKG